MHEDDTLIYFGDAVKVLDSTESETRVGGLLVHFDEHGSGPGGKPSGRDLSGEYFTAETYFGAQAKASPESFVLDSMFNHGIATSPEVKALAEHEFLPLKGQVTDAGIMAEIILRERDDYEKLVADMARAGKLGWSSGSAPHAVRRTEGRGGAVHITRWPLVEGSLTHTPAEPRTSAVPLKALINGDEKSEESLGLKGFSATSELTALKQESLLLARQNLNTRLRTYNW